MPMLSGGLLTYHVFVHKSQLFSMEAFWVVLRAFSGLWSLCSFSRRLTPGGRQKGECILIFVRSVAVGAVFAATPMHRAY